ncbi:3-hydroxyacyl-CoA dehydrogenase, NAD binding domain-containing protein [Ditylenchus destructor]|nr:3-hydroxyacyl-CoA dehydrogenase, NAD binding domain-containing protein [Ditylenchus destructor]
MEIPIHNITVIGAGVMGAGIAQVCIEASYNVILVDCTMEIVENARQNIVNNLERANKNLHSEESKTCINSILSKLSISTEIETSVLRADLVIEAIVENLKTKQDLFRQVESAAPSHALLATNTSSLKVGDIGNYLQRKHNFGGLHFFNPVPKMPLLEVIATDDTSTESLSRFLQFGKSIGKTTVPCKDIPGFIANRILIPMQREALNLVDRNMATPEDVDLACTTGLGLPLGPFRILDIIGLDTTRNIIQSLAENYPEEFNTKPSPTLDRLVAEGKLGRKTGEGFYKYKSKLNQIDKAYIMLPHSIIRAFSSSVLQAQAIKNVTVIGSGLMGSGIAQVSAQSQLNVVLVDQNQDILNKAQKSIEGSIKRVAKKKHENDTEAQNKLVNTVMKNITLSTDVAKAVSKADLVVEAISKIRYQAQRLLLRIPPRSGSLTLEII